jgi:hypothetical protein
VQAARLRLDFQEGDSTMQRRDFVKAMVAASVTAKTAMGQQAATSATSATSVAPGTPPPVATAPGPVPWTRGLLEVKPLAMTPLLPDAVAQTSAHFFNDQQMATLGRLCEVLLPALKGYPGAKDAGTPEFLDFLIGMSPEDRKKMYQSGLDGLEHEAQHRFQISFAEVSAAQADQLLRPWLRTWMTDHPPTDPHEHFINVAHSDIRTATINSQAWSDAANAEGKRTAGMGLFWYPIDPDVHRDLAPAVDRLTPKELRS